MSSLRSSPEGLFFWSAAGDGLPDDGNEILYAGYFRDAETETYHVRYRYYNTPLGRWLSRDPIGYIDGPSLYEYVKSEPVCFADPMGLVATDLPDEFEKRIAKMFAKYNKLKMVGGPMGIHHHWARGSGKSVRLGKDFIGAIKNRRIRESSGTPS